MCFETPDARVLFPPLLSCFRSGPGEKLSGGSAVTNCGGGGSSPAGIFPHKECLFCFTWTIFVGLSLFLSSFCISFSPLSPHLVFLFLIFLLSAFLLFFLPFCLPGFLIRWVGGGFYYFVLSSANSLVTSIIKRAC